MTWSYSGNPEDSNVDAVHFLIGDVNSATPYIQDEEIAYLLTFNSVLRAAVAAAMRVRDAFLATSGRKRVGDVQVDNTHLVPALDKRIAELRDMANRAGVGMTVGGLTYSGLFADASDPDAVQPMFRRTSDDVPGVGTPSPQPGTSWPW